MDISNVYGFCRPLGNGGGKSSDHIGSVKNYSEWNKVKSLHQEHTFTKIHTLNTPPNRAVVRPHLEVGASSGFCDHLNTSIVYTNWKKYILSEDPSIRLPPNLFQDTMCPFQHQTT